MKRFLRILIPVLIIAGAIGAVSVMLRLKKPAERIETPRSIPSIEALSAKRENVSLTLPSQGMIEAQRVTTIAAEVPGRVVIVSPKFNAGEQFAEGEILIEIDSGDYSAAVVQAESAVADARSTIATEQARAEQAVREWEKISGGAKANDLALRKPQIESAATRLKAAEAALLKSKHDLERTKVRAPYTGRIRALHTELGSYLTPGARVAEFFSLGTYEVRLPLSLDDYAFIKPAQDQPDIGVQISTSFGGQDVTWSGKIVRVEGEVERSSRSLYLIASIDEGKASATSILKPGLFVRAQIEGSTLENVFRIPRRAFLDERHLLTIDAQNRIRRRAVTVVRQSGSDWLVSDGLKDGERVCITTLAAPIDGMEIAITPPSADTTERSLQP